MLNFIITYAKRIMPLSAWRYAIVGFISTAVDFFVFLIALHWFEAQPIHANVIGFSFAVINSFLFNKKYVFKDTTQYNLKQFLKFVAVSSGGLLISSSFIFATSLIIMPEIAKLIAVGLTFIWGYYASRIFVFKD